MERFFSPLPFAGACAGRLLLATLLVGALSACGDDDSTPGSDADAGSGTDAAMGDAAMGDVGGSDASMSDVGGDTGGSSACPDTYLEATSHTSFVPDGQCPSEVARLIVMGDSISVGVGASSDPLGYGPLLVENDDATWADFAAVDLETRFGEIEYVNVAVGGAQASSLEGAQLDALDGQLPAVVSGHTVVTVTIGGNDLLAGIMNTDGALEGLEQALRSVDTFFDDETRFPDGVSLYVAAVYEPTDGTGQVEECFGGQNLGFLRPVIAAWRDRYAELGDELGFAMVDALEHFRGHGFKHDDPDNEYYDADDATLWFQSDCIHPNDRGHHEFRELFFEAIVRDYVAD